MGLFVGYFSKKSSSAIAADFLFPAIAMGLSFTYLVEISFLK